MADTKPPARGTVPEGERGKAPGYTRTALGSTPSFREEGGRAPARATAAPRQVGAPCSYQLEQMPLTECHSHNGPSFSLEASPSDPILRIGLPECSVREPFPRSPGGRPKDGGIHTGCSLGLLCHLTWFNFQTGRPCQWDPGPTVPSSPSGKESQMGRCFLQRVLNLRSHMFRCSDQRGSLSLLKSFEQKRFKVNN